MNSHLTAFNCHFTGISAVIVQPHNNNINPTATNRVRVGRQNESIRRYMCPVGFFRLKRYCYYLSGGTAPWREAYFHCKDRNATLAILDRNGKDRMLRKYLSSDQFSKSFKKSLKKIKNVKYILLNFSVQHSRELRIASNCPE